MSSSPLRITLARKLVPELLGRVSIRVWHGLDVMPEWFRYGLESARPCLGYGVLEPLELKLSNKEMTTVTATTTDRDGKTLLEHLNPHSEAYSDEAARNLIQQLCIGVLRIHQGQGAVHGALTPFNVHKTDDDRLLLWSVPTTRLELSFGDMDQEWEIPYRSPQVLDRETPVVADDIYSLGKLLVRLLCCSHQQFQRWEQFGFESLSASSKTARIVEQCIHPERSKRYTSVRDLAADLDQNSKAWNLDIAGAKKDKSLALSAFQEERFEDALSHWQDALKKDWLDLTTHNNMAVTLCALGKWEQALPGLERAYKIHSYHPLVNSNIGFCHFKLKDHEAADYWQKRAMSLNPNFTQSTSRLAGMAMYSARLEPALKYALETLHKNPRCRTARLIAAKALKGMGNEKEAQCHKSYAQELTPCHPLRSSLITEQTPHPWNLIFEPKQESVLDRYGIDAIGLDRMNTPRYILHKAISRDTKFGGPQAPSD